MTLKVIEKIEPLPNSLSTITFPPIYSTIDLQILSPKPRPEGLDF